MTYRIISKTDLYHARRYGRKCIEVEAEGLTLREAQKELLHMFNYDFDTYFSNWGHAILFTRLKCDSAYSLSDGIRGYHNDIWKYEIEEE